MTGRPRFEVRRLNPLVWHVLDRRTYLIDVVVFRPDQLGDAAGVPYAIARVTAEAADRHPETLEAVAWKLGRYTGTRLP